MILGDVNFDCAKQCPNQGEELCLNLDFFWLAEKVSLMAVGVVSMSKKKVNISETKYLSFYKSLVLICNAKRTNRKWVALLV